MKNDNTPVDIDFAEAAVPHYAPRHRNYVHDHAGFHLLLGQHVGRQELADGLDFGGFIISMIIGGLILSLRTPVCSVMSARKPA